MAIAASPQARGDASRAADRAAASCCRSSCWRRASSIVLIFVYGFILCTVYLSFTDSQDPAGLRLGRAARTTQQLFGPAALVDARSRTWRSSARSTSCICYRARPAARDPARPEDPRRGRAAADLPLPDGAVLHRHRHRLEVVPRSRHRPRADRARLGLDELHLRLDQGHATSRSTPSSSPRVWQSSGFVMAMFLAGLRGIDSEIIKAAQIDGASTFADLPAHHHPAAAAGVPVGLRRARPPGHQVLRPGRRADRRRARARPTWLPATFMYKIHLHPQRDGASARRRP